MTETNDSQTMKDITCEICDECKEISNDIITSTHPPTEDLPAQISKKTAKKSKPPKSIYFNHAEYFTTIKNQIHEYKLTELRDIVKYRKIKGAKTKQECVDKIDEYFVKFVNAIKIQRIYRGFLVRQFFKVRGGMTENDHSIVQRCVNETDFYTLEPLVEIKLENLFIVEEVSVSKKEAPSSVTTEVESTVHFYYGFNINSLITLYRKNGYIQNPYNRKDFTLETIHNIFTHYPIMCILFKESIADDNLIDNIVPFRVPNKLQINTLFTNNSTTTTTSPSPNRTAEHTQPALQRRRPASRSSRNRNTMTGHETSSGNTGEAVSNSYVSMFNNIVSFNTTLQELDTVRTSVNIFKQQSLSVRINELFMYVDQLGNYTDSTWFSGLNKRKYCIFYSQLRELWTFRAQIPVYVKNNICPLGDPFLNSSPTFRKPYDQTTEEEMCEGCLDVMENIIMTSLDVEYRKIGCLHVLTALAYVSPESRVQYGFLIE